MQISSREQKFTSPHLSHVEPLHLLVVLPHVVRSDGPEKPDVVVAVELGHLLLGCLVGAVDLHLPVESIVEQKVVGHPYPMGLHGMSLPIVVVANVACWETFSGRFISFGAPEVTS